SPRCAERLLGPGGAARPAHVRDSPGAGRRPLRPRLRAGALDHARPALRVPVGAEPGVAGARDAPAGRLRPRTGRRPAGRRAGVGPRPPAPGDAPAADHGDPDPDPWRLPPGPGPVD